MPSPDGREIPVFACVTAVDRDSLFLDFVMRGLQFADHIQGFALPVNLREAAKYDTTARRIR